jgi:hypothetical protein
LGHPGLNQISEFFGPDDQKMVEDLGDDLDHFIVFLEFAQEILDYLEKRYFLLQQQF